MKRKSLSTKAALRTALKWHSNPNAYRLLLCAVFLGGPAAAHAGSIAYTQDTNIADFAGTVQQYATFIEGNGSGVTLPYTPTSTILETPGYGRVIGRDNNPPIVVDFGSGVSQILVFDSIDHLGHAWDAYQYSILGSNDDVTFTPLFDPISVNEMDMDGIDQHFTLKTWTGTAPTSVNNTLSTVKGLGGTVGYEEYFDFSSSGPYRYYEFRISTLAVNDAGEIEQELAAVGQGVPVPEPKTWATMLIAFLIVGLQLLRHQRDRRQA